MKKDKSLIVIHTELGLLIGLLYYLEYIKGKREVIFYLIKSSEDRLMNLNLKYLPGEYRVIVDEVSTNILNPSHSYKEILNDESIVELIVQNPLNFIVNITVNHYRKRFPNIPLTMITDGVIMHSPLNVKSYIKWALKHFLRKYYNRINDISLFVKEYADMVDEMDCLIAHQNIGVKNYINTDSLFNNIEIYKDNIDSIFNINLEMYKNVKFIFFTQLIHEHSGFNKKYFNLIKSIVQIGRKYNISMIFKIHPADNVELYKPYESELVMLDISNKNLPAEVLLKMLNNKMIISVASSLSLSNFNKTLQHIWLSDIIKYNVDITDNIEHVIIPKNMQEFEAKIKLL